jgi:hypothetical protein
MFRGFPLRKINQFLDHQMPIVRESKKSSIPAVSISDDGGNTWLFLAHKPEIT